MSAQVLVLLSLAALVVAAFAPWAAAQGTDSISAVTDYSVDTDQDGRLDGIAVDVLAEAAVPGDYFVYGYLYSTNYGTYITGSEMTSVAIDGSSVVTLFFSGLDINRIGIDGPYILTLVLYDIGYNILTSSVSLTQAYTASDFDAPPVAIVAPMSAEGVDPDEDGLYEYLRVGFVLDVQAPGAYLANVWVYDPSHTYDAYLYSEGAYPAGLTPVSFDFSGWTIRSLDVPGPYVVQVTVQDDAYAVVAQTVFNTAAFDPSLFEPAPAAFVGPYTTSLTDSDGDGLANFISVDAPLLVNAGGDFYASASVFDPLSGQYFSSDGEEYVLGPGLTDVVFELSTIPMAAASISGPYMIDLQLEEFVDTWNSVIIGTDSFPTPAYASDAFDAPPAALGASEGGMPLDRDGDGVADVYQASVEVDVDEAGLYWFWGFLEKDWRQLSSTSAYRYLEPGIQTVSLDFPGTDIAAVGISGIVTLRIELGVLAGPQVARYGESTYETGPIDPTAFDAPVASTLFGTVSDAATGTPVTDAYVRAYNYETEDQVNTWTDFAGAYESPLYEGDWLVTVRDMKYTHAEFLVRIRVDAPSTQADFPLGPFVPDQRSTDIAFSTWDSVVQTRTWNFRYGIATRQEDDWSYGNRDGYLDAAEFAATRLWPGSLPAALPTQSEAEFQLDGLAYSLVPGSDTFEYTNVEGAIDDPSPIGGTQVGAYTSLGPVPDSASHVLSVSVDWDLQWYDRTYRVELPEGFVASAVAAPEGIVVEGIGSGTVILDPGLDPEPNDGLPSAWVTITAAAPAPTLSDVRAEPDPATRVDAVTISAHVTTGAGASQVSVRIFDPKGRLLGTFAMVYDPVSDRYAYTAEFRARGTYAFEVTVTDGIGRAASTSGTFTVERAPRGGRTATSPSGIG